MIKPCRRVVLGILLYRRTHEKPRVATHRIGHIGERIEREIWQDRIVYMCYWVRICGGAWLARARKRGSVYNGYRRLPVWPYPAGRKRWNVQLNAIQTPDLTDGFEIPENKILALLVGASRGPAELISM